MKQIPNNLFFAWVESEIAEGRSVRFRLKGHSMFPLLRNERDEVVLHPCTDAELQTMDAVLFRHQGRHVLHRILRREGDRLLIQGDGSFVARETCTVGDVIGKVGNSSVMEASEEPHLHLGMKQSGKWIDPAEVLGF